jgi:hypothetical protein
MKCLRRLVWPVRDKSRMRTMIHLPGLLRWLFRLGFLEAGQTRESFSETRYLLCKSEQRRMQRVWARRQQHDSHMIFLGGILSDSAYPQ